MKIVTVDLNGRFKNLDDGCVVDEKGNAITVKTALRTALATELKTDGEGDQAAIVERRLKNFDLLCEIRDCQSDKIALTPEQAEYLKGRCAVVFTTLVSGPLLRALSKVEELVKPTATVE
jgi:hypothetical protein